jgi:putative flippase GtrA
MTLKATSVHPITAIHSPEGSLPPSTLTRWCKFNLVGGIGIAVQFLALFLLKSVMRLDYLAATAIAVEATIVHNFVWHERFTWSDRILPRRRRHDEPGPEPRPSHPQPRWRRSLQRFVRFNLTNGALSILGNLTLMSLMVGQAQLHYLLANAIAIAICSLANFLASETWVFTE